MQDLVIVSQARSGSTFLGGFFDCFPKKQSQIFLNEIFNGIHPRATKFIFDHPPIAPVALNYFTRLYRFNNSHPRSHTELAPLNYYLAVLQAGRNAKVNTITKILTEQYAMRKVTFEQVYKKAGYVIVLYRKDILAAHVSYHVAKASDCWNSLLQPKVENAKMNWNRALYLRDQASRVKHLEEIKDFIVQENPKNLAVINYEKFVQVEKKSDYLNEICNAIGCSAIKANDFSPYKKQNQKSLSECVENRDKFEEDVANLSEDNRYNDSLAPFVFQGTAS